MRRRLLLVMLLSFAVLIAPALPAHALCADNQPREVLELVAADGTTATLSALHEGAVLYSALSYELERP